MAFRDIVGHRTLVGLLGRSIERGTLPPSLIFAGPSGVGKRLVAVAVAQALNCPNNGCGQCAICKRIARGVHPDVSIVEPEESGSIKIHQVRDIIDRAGYRPFEGRHRVAIIDEADALTSDAQSALLKSLEEPPSTSSFLLVTSAPDVLLPTVRSRCPKLTFRGLDVDDVATVLMRVKFKPGQEGQARVAAATSDGSVRRALEAADEDLVEVRNTALTVLKGVADAPPGSPRDSQRRRVEAAKELLPKGKVQPMVEREHLAAHLRVVSSILRDVTFLTTCGAGPALANADVQSDLEELSAFGGERGRQAFMAVDEGLVALERNAAAKIVADWVMLRI